MTKVLETGDYVDRTALPKIWAANIRALAHSSALDEKAANTAIAYFDGKGSVSRCADRLAVKRETVRRRLFRAEKNGWIKVHGAADKTGPRTRSRVISRLVFWPGGLPAWDGDTSRPSF